MISYKLFQCCEWAKRALSLNTDFELEVPELHPLLGAVYKQTITRAEFVAANKADFDRTIGALRYNLCAVCEACVCPLTTAVCLSWCMAVYHMRAVYAACLRFPFVNVFRAQWWLCSHEHAGSQGSRPEARRDH